MDKSVCSVPFVCSLSKKVRAGTQIMGVMGLKRAVIGIVEQFEADSELKASLQEAAPPGERIMRQVDIRSAPGEPVLFKTFVSWNWKVGMWQVFVEGPHETCFEDGEQNW